MYIAGNYYVCNYRQCYDYYRRKDIHKTEEQKPSPMVSEHNLALYLYVL